MMASGVIGCVISIILSVISCLTTMSSYTGKGTIVDKNPSEIKSEKLENSKNDEIMEQEEKK